LALAGIEPLQDAVRSATEPCQCQRPRERAVKVRKVPFSAEFGGIQSLAIRWSFISRQRQAKVGERIRVESPSLSLNKAPPRAKGRFIALTSKYSEMSDFSDDPIAEYFARFSSFKYRPSLDWRQLGPFNALAKHLKWTDEHRKKEFKRFKRTWTTVVESEFTGSSLSHYQRVCQDLDIAPIPGDVAECKAQLKEVFVNIVDLMQYRTDRQKGRLARKPRKFGSLEELSAYSQGSQKYYNREEAKAEMLRELLKVLT